ncbi:MAG: DMT family transporter [Candidatus Eremiobacteraeota bacterium]|nr:DMT family transporter [Candidatus Eremiobacteraeota bacterium]
MPYVRLLGAQLAIGAAAIFARFALAGGGPLAVSALRLGIAALVVLAFAGTLRRLSARRELAFGIAGLALAVHFATWIASLLYTSVAISTLLVTTTPLWTELYELLRAHRPPQRAFLAALACAFAGVALIVLQRAATPAPVPGSALLGDALALAGSLAIGAYLIIVRDAGARHADALATRQIVARTYSWAALLLCAAAVGARQPAPPFGDVAAWLGILAMALVSQLVGHTALNASLRDFSPSTIALTTLLEPVIAGLLAAALFRESLTPQAIAGGALVLGAIAITLRRTASARP